MISLPIVAIVKVPDLGTDEVTKSFLEEVAKSEESCKGNVKVPDLETDKITVHFPEEFDKFKKKVNRDMEEQIYQKARERRRCHAEMEKYATRVREECVTRAREKSASRIHLAIDFEEIYHAIDKTSHVQEPSEDMKELADVMATNKVK